jgi:hypothetical protein
MSYDNNNPLERLTYYFGEDTNRPLFSVLSKHVHKLCSDKQMTAGLQQACEVQFGAQFEHVEGFGLAVWAYEPHNNIWLGNKTDSNDTKFVLTQIDFNDIADDFACLLSGCNDDTYFSLEFNNNGKPYANRLGYPETRQHTTIAVVCYLLEIPMEIEINAYGPNYQKTSNVAQFTDFLQSLQEMDNISIASGYKCSNDSYDYINTKEGYVKLEFKAA